jgi:predicted phosphodiesterase
MRSRHIIGIVIGSIATLAIYIIMIIATGLAMLSCINALLGFVKTRLDPVIFWVSYAIILLFILICFMIRRSHGNKVPQALFIIACYALGLLLCISFPASVLFVVFWLAGLVFAGILHILQSATVLSIALIISFTSTAIGIVAFVYGAVHATNIRTKHYGVDIKLGAEPGAIKGWQTERPTEEPFRLVLVSDMHLGPVIRAGRLAHVVAAINAAKPDVVCIAGDTFDSDIVLPASADKMVNLLRSIHSKYGVYACLGNHDSGENYDAMLAFLSRANVRLLMDEAVDIGGCITLVGRKDSRPIGAQGDARQSVAMLTEGDGFTSSALPIVVMDHQPFNIKEYDDKVQLVLCGHTHHGQMFPANKMMDAGPGAAYGYFPAHDGKPQAIVTSGAGTWGPPLRIGTNSEVVVADLHFV